MDEEQRSHNDFEGKSGSQMLAEVGRLLLLLLGKMLRALGRLILRALKYLLKLLCKGLLWLIDATGRGIERLQAFWKDNDTQEKLRKMRGALVCAGQQLWTWTKQAAAATWTGLLWTAQHVMRGTVWLCQKTVQGIIHLGPTLRAVGRGLKQAAKAVGRWFRSVWRAIRKGHVQRQRAYHRFRKNKGFKGLLIDIGNWLRGQIRDYVDEEPLQQLPASGTNTVVDDDENVADDDDDDPFRNMSEQVQQSKVGSWGRSLYNAMKRVVED